MGWSCRADASKVMDLWIEMCVKSTGSSNMWKSGEDYYMEETSRKEHHDGAITGTILKLVPPPGVKTVDPKAETTYAVKVSTYKIEGDGTVKRGPAFLKALAKEAAGLSYSECSKRRWDAKAPA